MTTPDGNEMEIEIHHKVPYLYATSDLALAAQQVDPEVDREGYVALVRQIEADRLVRAATPGASSSDAGAGPPLVGGAADADAVRV